MNSPDSKVNNLDLNGDGDIDYIRVTDKTKVTFTTSSSLQLFHPPKARTLL
ncbi:MAG: hypothetical protein WDO15_22095 [Bacteroidota bacterium]